MSSRTADGQVKGSSDYKEILDQKAFEARHPNAGQEEPTLLEKVTEYIPAPVAKVLGAEKKEAEEKSPEPEHTPGPPERPHHDVNIEEFVREQHRSKKGSDGQIIDK
ncbi:hypothetical protein PG993_013918 [Apiospora rasikravindrae]|uniref:Uncharacterized protein n=1 Tax=Apiospora rasikravindrae TaxID=990691 RepID=A0ABR1RRV0_9PEZI